MRCHYQGPAHGMLSVLQRLWRSAARLKGTSETCGHQFFVVSCTNSRHVDVLENVKLITSCMEGIRYARDSNLCMVTIKIYQWARGHRNVWSWIFYIAQQCAECIVGRLTEQQATSLVSPAVNFVKKWDVVKVVEGSLLKWLPKLRMKNGPLKK